MILPVNAKANTIIVATIIKLKSIQTSLPTVNGLITPDTPKINKILKILDPITLPKAISFSPFFAATALVTSSGSEVPTATTVNPTTKPTTFESKPNDVPISSAMCWAL